MQDDWGYIYTGPDGLLNYVSGIVAALPAHPINITRDAGLFGNYPGMLQAKGGHEAAGPQATDAKSTSDAMCDVLQGWATALCNESRGRTMDDAVTALHRQHTRDGRPARFIPETE